MWRTLFILVVAMAWLTGPSSAQQSGPLTGPQGGTPPLAGEAESTEHILVIGDALGGGLGAGMERMAEAAGRYDVTIRFNEESGLARPEVYDWNARLAGILESADFDIIVVLIGSNDRQQIRAGNLRFAFNSPEWTKAYQDQTDRLLDRLAASGARVYWAELPPMANPDYDSDMRVVARLQRERAEARGVTYLELRQHFLGPDGGYTDTGPDDTGDIRKIRGRDGVSFFKQGNNRLGQIVLAAIAGGGKTDPEPEVAGAPEVAGVPQADIVRAPLSAPTAVPVFGQMTGAFGEERTVEPADVVATAVLMARVDGDAAATPEQILSALRATAKTGTAASEFFMTGIMAAIPPGRIDDYSVPAPDAD